MYVNANVDSILETAVALPFLAPEKIDFVIETCNCNMQVMYRYYKKILNEFMR
jgi:hypothetical protein